MKFHYLSIYRRPIIIGLWLVAGLTLFRLYLVVTFSDRVLMWDVLGPLFGYGLQVDFLLVGMLLMPPMLALAWLHLKYRVRGIATWAISVYLALMSVVVFFLEAVSAPFIRHFDTRPNALFLEYLHYPGAVMVTLWTLYPVAVILLGLIMLAMGLLLFRWLRRDLGPVPQVSLKFCLIMTALFLSLAVGLIRWSDSNGKSAAALLAFTGDPMVNTLPLNSLYLLISSHFGGGEPVDVEQLPGMEFSYGRMPESEMARIVLRDAGVPRRRLLDPAIPSLHEHRAQVQRDRPLNLVMIVMENIGAQHSQELGGRDLLPEFDSYAQRSIWFENLYATSMNPLQGLVSIVSAFPPSAASSTLKTSLGTGEFFTIAEFLRRQGYSTSFLHGANLDRHHLGSFLQKNGIETVIDGQDFDEPNFRGPWGVSDDDVFSRAIAHFESRTTPFFGLVLASGNRSPFAVPENYSEPMRKANAEGESSRQIAAIQYSDQALGRFLDQARAASFWRDTVFLVVSAHNVPIQSRQRMPVDHFRVPGMILGSMIRPRRIPGITSQIDLLPTLLSITGRSGPSPAIGRDLTRPQWRQGGGRAMMQFHARQAYIQQGEAVILQPAQKPRSFHILPNNQFDPYVEMDKKTRRKALAYARWGPYMIQNQFHRLAQSEPANQSQ